MKQMHPLLKISTAALVFALACDSRAAELDVTISGITPNHGTVLVGLFNPGMAFTDKPLAHAVAPANGARASVKFSSVAPGEYAVSAFQDTNGNQKLDRGKYGIPVEKNGFSRDAHGNYGPPDFGDASFRVGDKATAIDFTLE
jgi:uncharacterized protein (DUF2141 family)